MVIRGKYTVSTIENGYLVTDIEQRRTVFVKYDFDIGRQIERFFHDTVEAQLNADRAAQLAALSADALSSSMQNEEVA